MDEFSNAYPHTKVAQAARHLHKILSRYPDRTAPAVEVWKQLKALGITSRVYWLASRRLGVIRVWVGGLAEHGFYVVVLPFFPEAAAAVSPVEPKSPIEPAHERALAAYRFALEQEPCLRGERVSKKQVYAWLLEHAPQLREYLPPTAHTFRCQVSEALRVEAGGQPRDRAAKQREERARFREKMFAPRLALPAPAPLALPYYPDVALPAARVSACCPGA